jgi:hypothetical protein
VRACVRACARVQLEQRHDFIQWLFPSPQASRFNAQAPPLTAAEARAIRADVAAQARLLRSCVVIYLSLAPSCTQTNLEVKR